MKAGNKIVYNTAILYGRMLVTIGISLYSTRLILANLGASDYGLFNVVAGVVSMLAFLNAAMATATQRYLSFHMGSGDMGKVRKIFGNSILIHFLLGLFLVLVFELIGTWFVENKLNISPDRLWTAKLLFQFTVISSFISIISVPYDAVVNAHENMTFVAVINILESVLRLGVGIILIFDWSDKLLIYGALTLSNAVLVRIIKRVYCRRKYEESKVSMRGELDRKMVRELLSFASWNLFGVICGLARSQGVAIVLNLFFGTVINAAYALANQVNNQMSFLSMTMMKTVRPQMMKSEGAGDRQRMLKLSIFAGKFSFYLNSLVSIPMFIAMPQVLQFWLENVPDYTIAFCRYIVVLNLIQQFSMGIMAATQAIGKIKTYQAVVGTVQILTVPFSYWALRMGYPAETVMMITVGLEFVASCFRIHYFKVLTCYPRFKFLKEVVFIPLIPAAIVFWCSEFYWKNIKSGSGIGDLLAFFTFSAIIYLGFIYIFGISTREKEMIRAMLKTLTGKFKVLRN